MQYDKYSINVLIVEISSVYLMLQSQCDVMWLGHSHISGKDYFHFHIETRPIVMKESRSKQKMGRPQKVYDQVKLSSKEYTNEKYPK